MDVDDYCDLRLRFNTVPSLIQDDGTYAKEFEKLANAAESKEGLEEALANHRIAQLRLSRKRIEEVGMQVILGQDRMPETLWNKLLDLFQSPTTIEEWAWVSSVSLEGSLDVLDLFFKRLTPVTPPAIPSVTPAASLSAGFMTNDHQPPIPTRKLRPRKHIHKKEISTQPPIPKRKFRPRKHVHELSSKKETSTQGPLCPRKQKMPKQVVAHGRVDKSGTRLNGKRVSRRA